ncbi:MAG: ATP-binding protein, partial [Desulfuromonadaceae bacterium]
FGLNPKKWGWRDIAADCAGFANARGGHIYFGIEDAADAPAPGQKIDSQLPDRLTKGIAQHTSNVHVRAKILIHANGGEYLDLEIVPSSKSIASTSDARYYLRIADETRKLQPDELVRLVADKDAYQWETQITRRIPADRVDPPKVTRFITDLRASDRVKSSIKERPPEEILEHYFFVQDGLLTNLGVLWIGTRADRAQLLHAPIIQFLKFDSHGDRVSKLVWDDFSLNPAELIEAVWSDIPDWRESTELPDNLFRKSVPHYDQVVIRELIANALVHRPYTTRGDIFINLHPDYLEIHNPGLLPLGVTPGNILQKTVRRNNLLAQVFHDLKLMEREGTGYDRIYETQLTQAKAIPQVREEGDRVVVHVERRILRPELVSFLAAVDDQYSLNQRERIALGLIGQHGSLTAIEFAHLLQIEGDDRARSWLGSLMAKDIVHSRGQTRAVEYFVSPQILRSAKFRGRTTLRPIQDHRLEELIRTDLALYPRSSSSEIHARIGSEIPPYKLKRCLESLRARGEVVKEGKLRWTRYSMAQQPPNNPPQGAPEESHSASDGFQDTENQ